MKIASLLAMKPAERFSALAWLCVRVALAMILIGAVVHLFQTGGIAPPKGQTKPWIGQNVPSVIPPVVSAVGFGTGALLLLIWLADDGRNVGDFLVPDRCRSRPPRAEPGSPT
ncbi:MAG: hypothetical protein AVDCRST_MAG42-3083 [uncultured Chthoniobacterales bacterium]|uniref:Uncharacterized protein n=1 Tax=uncultured Chthoniobacterales bacterium TaxID=1836801 RepID=A0A6J4J2R8_9BACT|nr:MAG: hypothetical protein AVDCRST_MAG42-3083 [uncultured Chthoniobacterales bacterium]